MAIKDIPQESVEGLEESLVALGVAPSVLADQNTINFAGLARATMTSTTARSITTITGLAAGNTVFFTNVNTSTLTFSGLTYLQEQGTLEKVNGQYDVVITNVSDTATPSYRVQDWARLTATERARIAGTSQGTFSPTLIEISEIGYYDNYTSVGNTTITFADSGHIENTDKNVKVAFNGSHTLTFVKPPSYTLNIITTSDFTNGGALPVGSYKMYFVFEGGEILVVISEKITAIAGDTTAPTLSNWRILDANHDRVYFDSDEIITGTTYGGFTIATPSKTINAINIAAGLLTGHYFTVSAAFTDADSPTSAYSGSGSDIQDVATNALASFTATAITNNVDTTAPTWTTASFEVGTVADNIVVLPVDEALDATSVPVVGDFDIQVNASPNVVTNVDIVTNSSQVRLTLTTAVTNGQTVTAAYTVGTNPLRDTASTPNNMSSITATAVTNNVSASLTLLELKTFDDTTGWTALSNETNVMAIADDGGTNKLRHYNNGSGYAVLRKDGLFAIGDILKITLTEINIITATNANQLWIGDSVGGDYSADINTNGTMVFDNIDTTGFDILARIQLGTTTKVSEDQVVISRGNEISNTTYPTIAGLNGLKPRPP